jgi:hypothetical protein
LNLSSEPGRPPRWPDTSFAEQVPDSVTALPSIRYETMAITFGRVSQDAWISSARQ